MLSVVCNGKTLELDITSDGQQTSGLIKLVTKGIRPPKVSLTAEEYETRDAFTDAVLTESRLKQGIEYLEEMGHPVEMKSFGVYIKWVMQDVIAEEMDTMQASNIDGKTLGKLLPKRIREWFMENYA